MARKCHQFNSNMLNRERIHHGHRNPLFFCFKKSACIRTRMGSFFYTLIQNCFIILCIFINMLLYLVRILTWRCWVLCPQMGTPCQWQLSQEPAPGLWAHDFSPSEKSYQYLVGSDWGPWVCPVWRKGGWGADLSAREAAHWSKLPRQVASNPYLSVLRKPVPLTTLIFGRSWSLVGQDGHFSPNGKYLKCLSLCIKRHYGF